MRAAVVPLIYATAREQLLRAIRARLWSESAARERADAEVMRLRGVVEDRERCLRGRVLRIADNETFRDGIPSWRAVQREGWPCRLVIDFDDGPSATVEVFFSPALYGAGPGACEETARFLEAKFHEMVRYVGQRGGLPG